MLGKLLVRASECEGGVELGMTRTARLVAAALGKTLGPGCDFHVVADEVGDISVGSSVRLTLGFM